MSGYISIVNRIDPDPATGYVTEISDRVVEMRVYTSLINSPTLARFCADAEGREVQGFADAGIWVQTPFDTLFMCSMTLDDGFAMVKKWFIKEWGLAKAS